MIYDIASIPTRYNHVLFRSRLEARWAAFFDIVGWKWDYEPLDLCGWTPDFLIRGKVPALVEVKPVHFAGFEQVAMNQAKVAAEKAFKTAKSFRTTPGHQPFEIMVLGAGPFVSESAWAIGVLALERQLSGTDIAELHSGYGPHVFDYASRSGSYQYRMGGQHDGDHHISRIDGERPVEFWREAGNKVQWHPHRLREVAA